MRVSEDSRRFVGILQRAFPWARYVSRSFGGITRSVGALRVHEVLPEATQAGGFMPLGRCLELPAGLLPEVPAGVVMDLRELGGERVDG